MFFQIVLHSDAYPHLFRLGRSGRWECINSGWKRMYITNDCLTIDARNRNWHYFSLSGNMSTKRALLITCRILDTKQSTLLQVLTRNKNPINNNIIDKAAVLTYQERYDESTDVFEEIDMDGHQVDTKVRRTTWIRAGSLRPVQWSAILFVDDAIYVL